MVTSLFALLAGAVALVALSLATARRPSQLVGDFDGFVERWRPLHGDYDPSGNVWVLGWLRVAYTLSRPLARRGVLPDVVTVWGAWFGAAVLVAAQQGGRWPVVAALVLVVGGLADALDGCVAVLTARATRWGYVLDSLVDRVVDVIFLVALVAVGGQAAPAVVAGLTLFLLEYLRARAGNAGMQEIAVVTVGERPTRVVLCGVGLLAAGVLPGYASQVASAALVAIVVVCAVGVAQLGVAVRRRLVTRQG